LPLVSPLETAHGTLTARAGFLVSLEDEDGRIGTGEATPLPAFGGEDLRGCREALAAGLRRVVDASDALAAATTGDVFAREAAPCAHSALEAAIADLAAQRAGCSLAAWLRQR